MSILDDTYHDRIEAYLLKELPEEEQKAFEEEMEREQSLRDAVAEMKTLQADMKALERNSFLDRLNEIRGELERESLTISEKPGENEENIEGSAREENAEDRGEENTEYNTDGSSGDNKGKGKIRRFPRWYAAVAAAILLLIVPLYLVLRPASTLVDQYFEPYENLYSSRGSSDDEIKNALSDYDKGNYKESIVHFDAYLEDVPADSEAIFYSGIAHLAAEETSDAIVLLSSVQKEGFLYAQRARWYLALAYLQADRKADAKKVLEELKGTKDMGVQATELLNKIDE